MPNLFRFDRFDAQYKETTIDDASMLKNLNFNLTFAFFVHGWKSEFSIVNKSNFIF